MAIKQRDIQNLLLLIKFLRFILAVEFKGLSIWSASI